MLAAKAFYRAGYEIDVHAEYGKKREDFDFVASRGRARINVEVTALQEKEFYERTAINALNHKRTQLPDNKPAVIIVVVPPEWEKIGKDLGEWSATVADEFFRGTRRITAVVFELERHIDTSGKGTGGGFVIMSRIIDNPRARLPYNLHGIFEKSGIPNEAQLRMEAAAGDPAATKALENELRQGEFYDWVNSLVP